MTPAAFAMVLVSEICSVAGQIFFKHAMGGKGARGTNLAWGVAVKSVGFFVWLGVMSKVDLSYLFPFDALNRVMLLAGAWIFLKEKMTRELWVGIALICAGVLLVSRS